MINAKWIWAHNEDRPDEYAHFYDRFSYGGAPVYAEISCDGNYELYVNGHLAAFGQYADYPYRKVYDRIDLTPFCREGENCFSLLVWYHGVDVFTYYKGRPAVIYEVFSEEETLCCSDQTTLCTVARDYISGRKKLITPQMGFSYTFDGRGYQGWREADFLPTDYLNAIEVEPLCETLVARPIEKLALRPFMPASEIDRNKRIYDLGEETVGFVSIRFKGASGTRLTLSYGEHLVQLEDGTEAVPRIIGQRDFSVELIANGKWMDFTNFMRRLGCRFLQLDADGEIEVDRIGLIPTEYPLTVLPFDGGNPLRRRIYDTSVRTLRLCMFEHYEDCPWREQSLYNLDSRNQMLCGYYAFGEYRFPRASLELFCHDRSDTGILHICSPSACELYIPFFSLAFLLQMEEYARFSGDLSLLREHYGKVKDVFNAFLSREEDGLITNFYGDERLWNFYEWNPTLRGNSHSPVFKSFELVLNAGVCLCLEKMAWMADRVGAEKDSADYLSRIEPLREMIHRSFYDEKRGLYRTVKDMDSYSQLGNAMAILCGAAGAYGVQETVCKGMLEDKDVIPATLSMKAFLYDALLLADEEKYAPVVLSEIDRNYGYMLDHGATSFWETIKGAEDFHQAGSLCHGWSAIPVIYYHRLLGK